MVDDDEVMPALRFSKDKQAQGIFDTLRNLAQSDGRQELLEAGVAAHVVESLYPSGFAAILPRLAEYLADRPAAVLYSESRARWLSLKISDAQDLWRTFDDSQRERWEEDSAEIRRAPERSAFAERLLELQRAASLGTARMVEQYANILWNVWWPMANQDLLNPAQREQAGRLVVTSCWGMFPYLKPEAES